MSASSKIRKTKSYVIRKKIELSLSMRGQRTLLHIFNKPRRNKRAGVGTTASCLSRFIHPSAPIREQYPNTHQKERLTNLFITGRQVRLICRGSKGTEAYLLHHNDFENVDLYAASQNVTITAEGPSESLFEAPIRVNDDKNAAAEREREENSEERKLLPLSVSAGRNMTRDDFLELRNARFTVDDNNEPVPENIPVATTVDAVADTAIDRNTIAAEDWGFDGVYQWRTSGGGFFSPAKLKTTYSSSITRMSILEFFLLFYPFDYIKLVLVPQTNKHLDHRDMDFSEFLIFVGCWLYMACFEGVVDRRMWWSNM